MNSQLDDLFPRIPNENTLGKLIYDGLNSFRDRVWSETKSGVITYKQADLLSCEIAEFLKETVSTGRKSIQIYKDNSLEASITILAAVKAGFVLADQSNTNNNDPRRSEYEPGHFIFDNGFFRFGGNKISFLQAVTIGSKALIFGVSTAKPDDTALYAFQFPILNGAGMTVAVLHSRAVKQIFFATKMEKLHPYLRVIYNWFNGFRMPSY